MKWLSMETAPRDRAIIINTLNGAVEASWEQVDGGGHPENGPPVFFWVSPFCEIEEPKGWIPLPEDVNAEDTVRVIRLIEYVGPRSWVEHTVNKSIHGVKDVSRYRGSPSFIRAATLGTYPEILNEEVEWPRKQEAPPTTDSENSR